VPTKKVAVSKPRARKASTGKASGRKAKVLSSRVIFKGKAFGVRRDEVSEPGGVISTRDVVAHQGSVVLLPVFPDGSILLVRQYRHAVGRFLWELSAGHIEPGERASAAAHRELAEETGYVARHMDRLVDFFPSPGLLSERMWVFLATGLTAGTARPEEDERLSLRRFSMRDLEGLMRRGALPDGKSLAALLFYARFKKGR
jgi:ADP-ribose pyrophosphatase